MELLVVMGVIGLLLAISIPAAGRYSGQIRFSAATREVVGLLSLARSSAISSHHEQAVLVDADAGVLSMEDRPEVAQTRRVALGSNVHIRLATNDGEPIETPARLAFQPSGALVGRSVQVTLFDQTREQIISIAAPTGAIIVRARAHQS